MSALFLALVLIHSGLLLARFSNVIKETGQAAETTGTFGCSAHWRRPHKFKAANQVPNRDTFSTNSRRFII